MAVKIGGGEWKTGTMREGIGNRTLGPGNRDERVDAVVGREQNGRNLKSHRMGERAGR